MAVYEAQPNYRLPRWGVMFDDGSVVAPWSGDRQRELSEDYLARVKRAYPDDDITLAYRKNPHVAWERFP